MPSTTLRLTAAAADDELVTRLAALPERTRHRAGVPARRARRGRPGGAASGASRPRPTDIPFATIDPAGSRDLDQAFHLERDGGGIRFFYAIADVSAFVAHGGALDDEAHRRGQHDLRGRPPHPAASDVAQRGAPRRCCPTSCAARSSGSSGSTPPGNVTSTSGRRGRASGAVASSTTCRCRRRSTPAPPTSRSRLLREVGEARLVLERERGGASLNVPEILIEHDGGRYRLVRRDGAAGREMERPAVAADRHGGRATHARRRGRHPAHHGDRRRRTSSTGSGAARTPSHHPWPEGQPYGDYLDALDGIGSAPAVDPARGRVAVPRRRATRRSTGAPPAETDAGGGRRAVRARHGAAAPAGRPLRAADLRGALGRAPTRRPGAAPRCRSSRPRWRARATSPAGSTTSLSTRSRPPCSRRGSARPSTRSCSGMRKGVATIQLQRSRRGRPLRRPHAPGRIHPRSARDGRRRHRDRAVLGGLIRVAGSGWGHGRAAQARVRGRRSG